MAKRPDRPAPPKYRDPAKHSKKDPAKPTRAKAARPDSAPLDPSLADLLNPGIGRGRAGVGSQTGLYEKKRVPSTPSPLVGAGRVGGREATRHASATAQEPVRTRASPPDPHPWPLPTRGRGRASGGGRIESAGNSSHRSSRRRPTIRGIAAPISPTRTGRAPRWRAALASRRSRAMSARRRCRRASSIRTSPARWVSMSRKETPKATRSAA